MANIYKSNYTGAQIDEAIGKVATNEKEITNIKTGYIPIKDFATGPFQIPQIGYNKELNWIDCNTSISAQSIVQRDGNGIIYINPPDTVPENINEYAGVNVGYANKTYVKAINVTENTYVYAASSEGPNGRLRVSPTVEGGIVVQTTADATVRTNDPKNVYDAVNLQYLNKKLASKEAIIKDPKKSYFLWNADTVNFNNTFASDATVDWGDGTIESYTTDNAAPSHIYTDGNTYHLISISNLITILQGMFSNNNGLIKAYFGDSLMVISDNAFQACNNLNEIILLSEECLQGGIGERSFAETGLTTFTIPSKCGSISSKAFQSVPLMTIISHSSNVVTIASDSFESGDLNKIIVPKDSVAAYKAATGWSNYANIIGYEIESSTDINHKILSNLLLAGSGISITDTDDTMNKVLIELNGNWKPTYTDSLAIGEAEILEIIKTGKFHYVNPEQEFNFSLPITGTQGTYTLLATNNIKTINGNSIVGSGDITISGGGDVTLAGNNIFTGTNTFQKSQSGIVSKINVDPGPVSPLISVEKKEQNSGIAITSKIEIDPENIKMTDNGVGYAISMTHDGFKVSASGIYTDYHNGSIIHNTGSSGKQTLSFPNKSGTIALTSDIKIKSASLDGTTLTLTI